MLAAILATAATTATIATAEPLRAIKPAGPITAGGDLGTMLRSLQSDDIIAPARSDAGAYNGTLTMLGAGRGAAAIYFDDFSSYPRSTDPISIDSR